MHDGSKWQNSQSRDGGVVPNGVVGEAGTAVTDVVVMSMSGWLCN